MVVVINLCIEAGSIIQFMYLVPGQCSWIHLRQELEQVLANFLLEWILAQVRAVTGGFVTVSRLQCWTSSYGKLGEL